MEKKRIKELVHFSFVGNVLDTQRVFDISQLLPRKELKLYIKYLKAEIAKRTVIIESPYELSEDTIARLSDIFPRQQIVQRINDKLLLGVTIQDNDFVYDLSLKHTLGKLKDKAIEAYD